MAVKIVRQPKKIALIGAPSSAAAFSLGSEKAPAALRAAGIVERLQNAGFEVIDHGDCAPRLFADDDEHRRARNLTEIVAGLNDLKTRAEIAVKSGALALVLGGDCAQVIGLLTGARRYYKHINLLWFDRDADLNTPATTPSGRIDGMVAAHIIGKGAPELVRFWGETPLVREPDLTLFGIERLDPPEQEFLSKSAVRHISAAAIQSKGAAASATDALSHMHADAREFVLHLDTDVISSQDFPAVNIPGSGGLSFDAVRSALTEFIRHKNLLGLDVAQYNPDRDPAGTAAKKLIDLLIEALSARLESVASPETPEPAPAPASAAAESVGEAGMAGSSAVESTTDPSTDTTPDRLVDAASESSAQTESPDENALGASSTES